MKEITSLKMGLLLLMENNWNEKGEWVNAQFTGSDGSVVIEWYQIEGDQLISWVQTKGQAAKE